MTERLSIVLLLVTLAGLGIAVGGIFYVLWFAAGCLPPPIDAAARVVLVGLAVSGLGLLVAMILGFDK